ncbi:uncharacterized protein [Rutidosis leptorrhynchoides]|uniref:uncharacterized protein n=1 Tax=Rutidosis leptorrhynchoides TaxID=125765 RepID=UPI003A98D122
MPSSPIPISDISQVYCDTDDDSPYSAAAFSHRRCCYWMPCMQSKITSNWWQQISIENDKINDQNNRWWCKGLMHLKKIKEWSELVAGPKWKTFIRRFMKKRSKQTKQSRYQYDPASYSLNFDEGQACKEDNDLYFRDFSARYAFVPVSTKSSMDLGMDGVNFIHDQDHV